MRFVGSIRARGLLSASPALLVRSMATRNVDHQSSVHHLKYGKDGSFQRVTSTFRNFIEPNSQFPPEKDRYHLYVSLACPWAHRALIARHLKGLQDILPITVVSPHMGPKGWPFATADEFPGADPDPNIGAQHVRDLYLHADPDFSSRFTVPVIWDKKLNTIVNNESSEILRIFNTAFNSLLPDQYAKVDLYPSGLQKEIDELNEWVYDTVNNGVYKSGAAQSQGAYENACTALFASLDRLEKLVSDKRSYLIGDQLTEADIRLYTTLVRFDPVYHGLFKCNIRTIRHGYPGLDLYMRKLYWGNDAFGKTTDFNHIKTHYWWSLTQINPTRIIPVGPDADILPL